MNITALIGLHLHNYLVASGLDPQLFAHLSRQIDEGQDLQDRKNMDGHVTSSFALLNEAKTHVLMIHHLGFDKWLFPGGHYEGDVSIRESALRELEEETGFPKSFAGFLTSEGYLAIDLDTHVIAPRPEKGEGEHWHHDFLYLGIATQDFPLVHQVEEVAAAKWIALDEVALLPDERVRRAAAKIIKMVKA